MIQKAIERQIEKYDKLNPEHMIHYICGKAVSGEDGIFEIRDLLRLAVRRMHSGDASPVSERASGAGAAAEIVGEDRDRQ